MANPFGYWLIRVLTVLHQMKTPREDGEREILANVHGGGVCVTAHYCPEWITSAERHAGWENTAASFFLILVTYPGQTRTTYVPFDQAENDCPALCSLGFWAADVRRDPISATMGHRRFVGYN